MAWDSKSARRRQGSIASGTSRAVPFHTRQQSKQLLAIQPKSAHVADPFLQDFLNPSFDPVTYLNAILPPLSGNSTASAARSGGGGTGPPVPLAELSTQAQTTVSQLNIHTTRLTGTLSQLTDEILRSGSRLAYEVELLRGETLGLAETLTEGLHDDIVKFVPGGVGEGRGDGPQPSSTVANVAEGNSTSNQAPKGAGEVAEDDAEDEKKPAEAQQQPGEVQAEQLLPNQPAYITQLRTLTLVRSRLDSVIKTFGEAMEFVFPPSEVSVSSSFLSVSAPEPGSESHSTEELGKQVLQRLRDEISALAAAQGSVDEAAKMKGIEDAARRVEELKQLSRVWHGTAEEKGRAKFVENLARIVEDRHRDLLMELELAGRQRDGAAKAEVDTSSSSAARKPQATGDGAGGSNPASKGYASGYGFISQLQKIRGGL